MAEQNTATATATQAETTDAIIAEEQATESRLQEQCVAAADRAAEEEAKLRTEADGTLKACTKAYRKGERAYSGGMLESGRLADVYTHQRLALGDSRSAAVQAVEGDLAKWSSTSVDANRLIACYHAYRLLSVEPSVKADNVPYGYYRDAWMQLVERHDKDTPTEHWVLLPGVETECRAAFAKGTDARLSLAKCQEAVKGLQRQYMTLRAKAAEEVKAAADATLKAQANDAETKRIETLRAIQESQQAEARAATASEADKPNLTAAAELARQELHAKQLALTESLAKADADKRAADKADADAKAKRDAESKAAEKERKAREKAALKAAGVKPPKADPKGVTGPLQPVGDAVTPEQAAEFCQEQIEGHEAPDTVLERLLQRLSNSRELCPTSKRALDAALVILHREDKPRAKPQRMTEAQHMERARADYAAVVGEPAPTAATAAA